MDGDTAHRPVLCKEVLDLLCPAGSSVLIDCTIGPGGHAEALLAAAGSQGQLIGIDLDKANLELAKQRLERFSPRVRFFQANFADLDEVLAVAGVSEADVILADLGVSSNQLDDPARGFSFTRPGPLDMRMDPQAERTAEDLVNSLGESELADLIYANGQERYSRRIAGAIVQARKRERIAHTQQLARIVAGAIPSPARRTRRGVHPATRTFQAIRIAVNDELASLEKLLAMLPDALKIGGTAGIISFHSLEDRRVKNAFRDLAKAGRVELLTKKPITATAEEVAQNPRSRSARLRGIKRQA